MQMQFYPRFLPADARTRWFLATGACRYRSVVGCCLAFKILLTSTAVVVPLSPLPHFVCPQSLTWPSFESVTKFHSAVLLYVCRLPAGSCWLRKNHHHDHNLRGHQKINVTAVDTLFKRKYYLPPNMTKKCFFVAVYLHARRNALCVVVRGRRCSIPGSGR